MTDAIVRVGGRSKQVQRAFRADHQARRGLFYAREFAATPPVDGGCARTSLG